MKIKKKHVLGSMIVTSMLYACGGGSEESSGSPVPISPVPTSGTIALSVMGLPDGTTSTAVVAGPDGYTQNVSGNATLENLAPGNYTITPAAVVANGLEFDVLPASISFVVSGNSTATQELIYMTDVISNGVITNFGSVFVNGVRFSTDDATVTTDDSNDASEDELNVGMNVTVKGRQTADGSVNTASEIAYFVHAEGPVDSVSLRDNQVVVFGQVYQIDSRTVFEYTVLSTIKVGEIIEVSAIKGTDNLWLATRIELQQDDGNYKLKGEIGNLNETEQSFNVGDTLIDYSQAVINDILVNGALAKISTSQAIVNGVLIASSIDLEDDSDSDQVGLDGIISNLSDNLFSVDGKTITWNEGTNFSAGISTDLNVGVRVKIEGIRTGDTIVASEIRFDKQGEIEIEGAIQTVDVDNSTITVLDTVFLIDSFSQLKDDSDANIRRFRLDLLNIGDLVEVDAFVNGDNLVVKTLERQETSSQRNSDDAEAKLKGKVIAINSPTIQLQGSLISTNQFTDFELGDSAVLAETFFTQLNIGDWIEVEGIRQADGSILATDVETSSANGDNGDDNSGGVEFTGIISNFDSVEAFTVNGRLITTNELTEFKGNAFSAISEGVLVEIYGREAENGSILATRIKIENNDNDNNDDFEFEIKGVLEADAANGMIIINQQQIRFDQSTAFSDGSVDDLVQGALVEVEATSDDNGLLFARKIEIDDGDYGDGIEVDGEITDILENADIVVAGVTIILTEATDFKNGNTSRIEVGVYVEIEGQFNAEQKLVATEVEFNESTRSSLEGTIGMVLSNNQFMLGNFIVQHDQYTAFKDGSVNNISQGVRVEIKGTINDDDVFVAQQIDFDED